MNTDILLLLIWMQVSPNFTTLFFWMLQLVANIIGWYIVAARSRNAEVFQRIDRMEKKYDKLAGWIQGRFQVDLNGD